MLIYCNIYWPTKIRVCGPDFVTAWWNGPGRTVSDSKDIGSFVWEDVGGNRLFYLWLKHHVCFSSWTLGWLPIWHYLTIFFKWFVTSIPVVRNSMFSCHFFWIPRRHKKIVSSDQEVRTYHSHLGELQAACDNLAVLIGEFLDYDMLWPKKSLFQNGVDTCSTVFSTYIFYVFLQFFPRSNDYKESKSDVPEFWPKKWVYSSHSGGTDCSWRRSIWPLWRGRIWVLDSDCQCWAHWTDFWCVRLTADWRCVFCCRTFGECYHDNDYRDVSRLRTFLFGFLLT